MRSPISDVSNPDKLRKTEKQAGGGGRVGRLRIPECSAVLANPRLRRPLVRGSQGASEPNGGRRMCRVGMDIL